MIRWLVQSVVDHPDLLAGRPPAGLLAPAEEKQYQTLLSPQRRRDWLLGRWTAKQLVQSHFAATDGYAPALDSFTIEYDHHGAPYAAMLHLIEQPLSISHSNGYAFCALSANNSGQTGVGADIELVEPRGDHFTQDFFTASEQTNIRLGAPLVGPLSSALPAGEQDLLATATWSAKEALLKAKRTGFRSDPCSVECLPRPARPRHWTAMQAALRPAITGATQTLGPLRVWWRVLDNQLRPGTAFVLTLAAFGTDL